MSYKFFNFLLPAEKSGTGVPKPLVLFSQTESVFVATTDQVTLLGAGVGTKTLAANFWTPGMTLIGYASGTLNLDPGLSGDGIRRMVLLQNVAIFDSGIANWGRALTNCEWWMEFEITCQTVGASGDFVGKCRFTHLDPNELGRTTNLPFPLFIPMPSPNAFQLDTTAPMDIDITEQFSSSLAPNSTTLQQCVIEFKTPIS